MTFPVTPSLEVSASGHVFESFDQKVCRIIFTALYEDFEAFIEKGLDPNYVLSADVTLEGMIFAKGSSLLMVVIQCCTITTTPWDLWAMMKLLLEKGADIKKRCPTRGGGKSVS